MTKQAKKTEVVKIRLGSSEKVRLEELARIGERTFAGQVRLVVREWLNIKRRAQDELETR